MTVNYQHFRTTQPLINPALHKMVLRYQNTQFLRPIPDHQLQAFYRIEHFVNKHSRPIILDSGCGTGLSTINLAQKFEDHLVIGIDKSSARLSRAQKNQENCLLVQGDLIDLWRLFKQASLPIERHYMFYPNPWPKIGQLKRRFYAHPVWSTMVTLASYFELRTNWQTYALEAMYALKLLGQKPKLNLKKDPDFISLFEKKYLEAGCTLYKIENQLVKHNGLP